MNRVNLTGLVTKLSKAIVGVENTSDKILDA